MAYTTPRTWVTDEVVTAAIMNTHVRDNFDAGFPDGATTASWTPVLSGASSGSTDDPAVLGREYRIGPLQFAWALWEEMEVAGVSGFGTGSAQFILPQAASGLTTGNGGQVIGTWRMVDDSATANSESGAIYLASTTLARLGRPVGSTVTDSTPFSVASGDRLSVYVCYPVA